MTKKFNTEKTAISRKTISAPLQYLLERKYFLDKKYHRALDYGCGKGKDVSWLREFGYSICGWDPFWFPDNKPGPEEDFDVVLVSYVLNVIPFEKERLEVLQDAWSYVAIGGFLLLSTRTDKEIKTAAKKSKWEKFGDGFISSESKMTFQKGFTGDELEELIKEHLDNVGFVEPSRTESDFSYVLIGRKVK